MGISGSCFCKAVKFKVNGEYKSVVNCHCDFCRKHSGAAFSTYVAVSEAALEITSGADSLATFQLEGDAQKHFCKQCGSPLFNGKNARYPGLCMIYLGSIDGSAIYVPTANIHCESQLAWVPTLSELRAFPQGIGRHSEK